MNQKLFIIFLGLAVLLCATLAMAKAPDGVQHKSPVFKPNQVTGAKQTKANLCNWSYWFTWEGMQGHDPLTDQSGGVYPRGTAAVVYMEGLVWGGIVRDVRNPSLPKMRVGGDTYSIGTVAGQIITPGTATTPPVAADANAAAIYRVRWDWESLIPRDSEGNIIANPAITDFSTSVVNDAAEIAGIPANAVSVQQCLNLIDQYEYDWLNWPVALGAPYYDVNKNGVYDPGYTEDLNGDGRISMGEREEPGIAGADQVIWFVINDTERGTAVALYGSEPIGLEVQITVWCYNQPSGTLGQLLFKKYRIINKSGFQIDSMFVSQWCDPDVGIYTDDFVGNDVERSLGFAYNAALEDGDFRQFGLPPAAVGYDFFQGPIVASPGDTAIFGLKKRPDYRNLPMTSFGYFAAGSLISDPDLGEYAGTMQWYNLMNGYWPLDDTVNVTPFTHGFGPNRGQPTFFPVDGDPVALTGDIDGFGDNLAAGDRRMCLSSGPFTMMNGDTQEVVLAIVGGIVAQQGGNNRNAVAQLKLNDDFAQFIFNNLFEGIPSPPAAPDVRVTPRYDQVMLEWGSNLTRVAQTESMDPLLGFNFEGYNIYQLPTATATIDQARKVATFDLANNILQINAERFVPSFGDILSVPVQKGTDTGIQRYFVMQKDYINDQPLYAGNEYYFAVTAYNAKDSDGDGIVDQDVPEPTLESAINVIVVIPQTTTPGTRFGNEIGDVLAVTHTGPSDGVLQATVVDPARTTGRVYEVFFTLDEDTNSVTYGDLLWNLRYQGGSTLLRGLNQAATVDAPDIDKPIVDGIEWIVTGPSLDFKKFEVVANAGGVLDPPEIGCFAFNNNGFPLLDGADRPSGSQQTNGSTWGIHTGMTGANDGTYEYFIPRVTQGGARWSLIIPNDFEIRFTAGPNWGFEPNAFITGAGSGGTAMEVPFELWNIGIATPDNTADDYRLFPYLIDSEADGAFNLAPIDHSLSGGDNDPETDWFYWVIPADVTPGQAGYEAIANEVTTNPAGHTYLGSLTAGTDVMRRMVLVNWNGGSVSDPTFPANMDAVMPEQGTVFRITSTKPNGENDIFAVQAPAVTVDPNLAMDDVERINVFPNPYYAYNPSEIDRFNRFVTFNHLPRKATLRIFSLSGVQVRKLEKDSDSQFLQWDLRNEQTLPVASGMYIVYIDMPDLGKQKILKVMIIQGEEILQYY